MEKTVSKFLRLQGIKISKQYVEKRIKSHPDYPSLLSVADTFESIGINYSAWRSTREALSEVEFPYMLPVTTRDFDLMIVRNQNDLIDNYDKLGYWNGIILQVDKTDFKSDEENERSYRAERARDGALLFLLIALLGVLFTQYVYNFNVGNVLLMITALAGIVTGYLLVAKDLGVRYASVESFCKAGKSANCDIVLNSNAATLFGFIKLSDLVLIYFIFEVVSPALIESAPSFLYLTSMLSIPVVIFSVFYQYNEAKAWCRLCLIVSGLLLLQAAIFFALFPGTLSNLPGVTLIFTGVVTFLVVAVMVLLVKDFIAGSIQKGRDLAFANRVKNSVEVFSMLLFNQPKVDTAPIENEIVIGNPEAPVNIIIVSNVYCAPCEEQHEILSRLFELYPEKISITVRLWPEAHAIRGSEANHYLVQYWRENFLGKDNASGNAVRMLHDWFKTKNLKVFSRKYHLINDIDDVTRNVEALQSNWMAASAVLSTPTLFLNGYRMPLYFSAKELSTMMPSLLEHIERSKAETVDL